MDNSLHSLLGQHLSEIENNHCISSLPNQCISELIEDRYYMELPNAGISLIATSEGIIKTVQLFREGYQGYQSYTGRLPKGIRFSDSRTKIHELLGKPSNFGGGQLIQFFGKAPIWDRYDWNDHSLHIQYTDDEKYISLVTLISPDWVPDRRSSG